MRDAIFKLEDVILDVEKLSANAPQDVSQDRRNGAGINVLGFGDHLGIQYNAQERKAVSNLIFFLNYEK